MKKGGKILKRSARKKYINRKKKLFDSAAFNGFFIIELHEIISKRHIKMFLEHSIIIENISTF